LGKIWVKIAKPLVIEIQTERTGIAPRGTVFSVEYDPKTQTTVVEVEKGLVEVRNLLGTLQTLVVEAGQMAIQTGHQPPRLKK
jgi:ferric-dicitrate binding protein FerR (iron transport regulator)